MLAQVTAPRPSPSHLPHDNRHNQAEVSLEFGDSIEHTGEHCSDPLSGSSEGCVFLIRPKATPGSGASECL